MNENLDNSTGIAGEVESPAMAEQDFKSLMSASSITGAMGDFGLSDTESDTFRPFKQGPLYQARSLSFNARHCELRLKHNGCHARYKDGRWRMRVYATRERVMRAMNLTKDAIVILEVAVDAAAMIVEETREWTQRAAEARTAATFARRFDGYVYIFADPMGRYKVGRATCVEGRMAALSAACGLELKLVYSRKCENVVEDERVLHGIFAAHRTKGEWFNIPHDHPELVKLLSA